MSLNERNAVLAWSILTGRPWYYVCLKCNCVWNNGQIDCLFIRYFGFCVESPSAPGRFHTKKASNAEIVSISYLVILFQRKKSYYFAILINMKRLRQVHIGERGHEWANEWVYPLNQWQDIKETIVHREAAS